MEGVRGCMVTLGQVWRTLGHFGTGVEGVRGCMVTLGQVWRE